MKDKHNLENTSINNTKANQDSGKISFTEPAGNALALNPDRYLMAKSNVKIDFTDKESMESLKIDYTKKDDDSENNGFELIFEVSPGSNDSKKKKKKKRNLPMNREDDFKKEYLELQKIYRDLIKRQAELSYDISNSFMLDSLEMQKEMADNYFELIEKMLDSSESEDKGEDNG